MKNIFIMLIVLLLLSGCASDPTKDGKYVKDKDGNIYLVDHRIFDCYFLTSVDKEQISSIVELSKQQENNQ